MAKRFRAQAARTHKLWKLAKFNPKAAKLVFTGGLVPSFTLGAEVWGASDKQVEEWQRMFVKTLGRTAGKSKTATLLLCTHPHSCSHPVGDDNGQPHCR